MLKFFKMKVLQKKLDQEKENSKLLKNEIKSLLWNIANQQEKVQSNLSSLLPVLFPNRSEEEIFSISKTIMKGMKR